MLNAADIAELQLALTDLEAAESAFIMADDIDDSTERQAWHLARAMVVTAARKLVQNTKGIDND